MMYNIHNATQPPARAQLTPRSLLRMSLRSLRHQVASSLLQLATIAATAALLMYVLGQIILERAAPVLGFDTGGAEGKMAQLIWMLVVILLVCAISNITSMLLSVTRRFREIGTLKCLGAFDHTVLALFMMEAVLLGGTGAVAGTIIGVAVTVAGALLAHGPVALTGPVPMQMATAMLLPIVTVAALSLAGAAYPSWQASKMLPITAMRNE